jgi:hypothetical protein
MQHFDGTLRGEPQARTDVFGIHALRMCREGFAVLPTAGKRPLMSGFDRWSNAPQIGVVAKWAADRPDADIAYVPGISKAERGGHGLVVVDADDAEACDRIVELFGDTPGKVKTRRGAHFIFRDSGTSLGKLTSLKSFGINADLKHGNSIVIAPPSRHAEERDFTYSWIECNASVIHDLPPFDAHALQKLTDGARGSETLPNATKTAPAPGAWGTAATLGKAFPHLFRDGSRKLGLNDHLAAHAWAFSDDTDACLDVAHTWNRTLADHGIEPLSPEKVVRVCNSIMRDIAAGKLVKFQRQRAIAMTDGDEIRALMALAPNGAEAFSLLQLLRVEHGARCKRGETFSLVVESMVRDRVMGKWSARRYREARDVLLQAGLIREVREARHMVAAEYTLADRVLTPSIAVRRDCRPLA